MLWWSWQRRHDSHFSRHSFLNDNHRTASMFGNKREETCEVQDELLACFQLLANTVSPQDSTFTVV